MFPKPAIRYFTAEIKYFCTMLKRLALIFIVAAGLFALQPEVPLATRLVATTEFVVSAKKQEAQIAFVEPATQKPVLVLLKSKTTPGFTALQARLISSQYFHSSLPAVA